MAPVGPDKKLINRAFRMKLVLGDRDGHLHFIEPFELYEKIYSHDLDGPMSAGHAEKHLKKLETINITLPATLWGGVLPGPTQAQVLMQIPSKYLKQAVAYEIHTSSEDPQNGAVPATLTLYSGKLPDEIKAQSVVAWKKEYKEPFPAPPRVKKEFNAQAATTLADNVGVMKPITFKAPAPAPKPQQ